jgi:protein-tyrosine phosphatase
VSYVDLHSHLLPGLDDGAATMQDSVAYARRLHADGVRDVACTPHIKRDDFPDVRIGDLADLRARTQAAITADGLDIRLHPGGELAHPDALGLDPDELDLIAQGPYGAPYLLLECPFAGIDDDFLAAAGRLTGLGYGLLLAHPERSFGLMDGGGLRALEPVLAHGAQLQVNVSSLLGRHGPIAQHNAIDLVRDGQAYCLASDGHPGTREDTLHDGFRLLTRRMAVTRSEALRLTQTAALRLVRQGMPRGGDREQVAIAA